MSRLIIGPFNRVEGDLEVRLDIHDDHVENAYVVSPLYRGFEHILAGKDPRDALVYAPRICGICSISQSVAAAKAIGLAQGIVPTHNGKIVANLLSACENIADHLTHFYLFFMPDFAREIYSDEAWYSSIQQRFMAVKGSATKQVLPARAQFLNIMGILAGKWPHTLSIQPGGSTKAIAMPEILRLKAILNGFQNFLETVVYGDDLQTISQLNSIAELQNWQEERRRIIGDYGSDFLSFLHVSDDIGLIKLGRSVDHFMSFGAYEEIGTAGANIAPSYRFKQGVFNRGGKSKTMPIDLASIGEDVSHAWMIQEQENLHPSRGQTKPDTNMDPNNSDDKSYTWCKAPRLDGAPIEVGALARQVVDGHGLARDLVATNGGNVHSRVVTRFVEMAMVTLQMQTWLDEFILGDQFCRVGEMPNQSKGVGLTEAARGALGHWLCVDKGRISNYQIIAPTTWNFSPRDENEIAGPLEQALIGAPIRATETEPVSVQHIVRSFDPCMVCTVH